MAEAVGGLFIDLSANSAAFARDMGKARTALASGSARMNRNLGTLDRGFARLGRAVSKSLKGMISLRGAVGLLAGGAGLGLLIKRSIDVGDSIGKNADRIGITTDALQEYRFAADIAGVSTEALDSGLGAFVKRLGEARADTGTLITILKKMDPALLANLKAAESTEAALELMFRALAGFESQADRAALAAAAFGRTAGVGMTLLVKKGAAALEEMRKKARDLGLVISEDLVRGAETAKDQLTILGTVISTKVTAAVLGFTPEIGELADGFIRLIPEIVAGTRAILEFFGALDQAPTKRLDTIDARLAELRGMGEAAKMLDIAVRIATGKNPREDEIRDLVSERGEVTALIAERARLKSASSLQVNVAPGGTPTAAPSGIINVKGISTATIQAANNFRDLRDAEIEMTDAAKAGFDFAEEAAKSFGERIKAVTESTRTPQEKFNSRLDELNDLLDRAGDDFLPTYSRAVEQARDDLDAAAISADAGGQAMQRFGNSVSGAFEDAIFSAQSFGEIFRGLVDDISRQAFRSLVSDPLTDFVTGTLKSWGRSLLSAGGGVPGISADLVWQLEKGGVFNRGGVVPFARGGVVSKPTVFPFAGGTGLMGEAGPEAILPLKRGPGGALGVASSGGGKVEINIIDRAGTKKSVKRSKTSGGGQRIDVLLDELVAQNIRRPGSRTRGALEQSFGASETLTPR